MLAFLRLPYYESNMKIISTNRRAYHDYEFEKEYDVGIVLKWHEVKSIKSSQLNIKDAIVRVSEGELWIYNMDIPLYGKTSPVLVPGYQAKGKRKLLITKKELAKLSAKTDNSGYVVIPLEVFISKTGLIKVKIWLGRLMKKVEKKQILKERGIKREMDREIKNAKF